MANTSLIRIQLLKAHTHAGRALPAGDFLDIQPSMLAWFTGQGIAEEVTGVASKSSTLTQNSQAQLTDPTANQDLPHPTHLIGEK